MVVLLGRGFYSLSFPLYTHICWCIQLSSSTCCSFACTQMQHIHACMCLYAIVHVSWAYLYKCRLHVCTHIMLPLPIVCELHVYDIIWVVVFLFLISSTCPGLEWVVHFIKEIQVCNSYVHGISFLSYK